MAGGATLGDRRQQLQVMNQVSSTVRTKNLPELGRPIGTSS